MNKYEKLIEYIINDDDAKARELFHEIVVEKSRDIYESIMDEENMEETVAGNQVEDMVDEVGTEEAMGEDDEEGAEFDLDQSTDDGEVGGDLPADMDDSDSGEEHAEIEDKVMDIDAKLDELLAKFDEIMGDQGGDSGMDSEEPAGDAFAEQTEEVAEEQVEEAAGSGKSGSGKSGKSGSGKSGSGMMEGENPFAKSGKSGKSGSGKSGSAKSGASGKSGSGKTESRTNKSTTELMREYVDKIGDIYGGAGDAAEGDAVAATGKKTSVNTKSIVGPGADFGGSVVKRTGADNANPDGTSAPSAPKPEEIKSGNRNVPGGQKATLNKAGSPKTAEEGSVNDTPVQKQNTGKK